LIDNIPVFEMLPSDCIIVCQKMRRDDFDEFIATQEAQTKDDIIKQILAQNGEQYVIYNRDALPVIIGGIFYDNPGVGTLWLIATDDISYRDWWYVTKFITGLIDTMFEKKLCHRIQASSIGYRKHAQKWLKRIGLEYEGNLKGFCNNGYDLLMFGKIRS
tara:strand:+ start:304 stop:783 length:480 start_codon:yes stop_codon:yes gene_type:complete